MAENNAQKTNQQADRLKASTILQLTPAWLGNLLIFGLLITIICVYFFWQLKVAQKTFLYYVREHTRILSEAIKQNAENVVLSEKTYEETIRAYLSNTAYLIDFLDEAEPFSEITLSSFARKMELTGICIVRNKKKHTQSPGGWLTNPSDYCQPGTDIFQSDPRKNLRIFALPRDNQHGSIIVGLAPDRIEKIVRPPAGLIHIMDQLSGINGISYVKIEPGPHKGTGDLPGSEYPLVNKNKIAETRLSFGNDMLVVGLDTSYFFIRERQLINELIVFSAIIGFISALFSWLIILYHRAHLEQVREFERKLAKEHEDAALGRASATITHEIRNPLNAIHMGLQRLQIESEGLNEEHRNLISTILGAVKRTNGIVTNLRRYAAPLIPNRKQVDLTSIVNNMLILYQQQCSDQAISVTFESRNKNLLAGDPGLLEEVVENLIKNAIEAQPDGGYLKISIFKQESYLVLFVENSGYDLSEKEAENILEPYFTTKTRGSGLGLAVAKRIVLAHEGRIETEVPARGIIRISVYLPLDRVG